VDSATAELLSGTAQRGHVMGSAAPLPAEVSEMTEVEVVSVAVADSWTEVDVRSTAVLEAAVALTVGLWAIAEVPLMAVLEPIAALLLTVASEAIAALLLTEDLRGIEEVRWTAGSGMTVSVGTAAWALIQASLVLVLT